MAKRTYCHIVVDEQLVLSNFVNFGSFVGIVHTLVGPLAKRAFCHIVSHVKLCFLWFFCRHVPTLVGPLAKRTYCHILVEEQLVL
jgi:hypothetical protein